MSSMSISASLSLLSSSPSPSCAESTNRCRSRVARRRHTGWLSNLEKEEDGVDNVDSSVVSSVMNDKIRLVGLHLDQLNGIRQYQQVTRRSRHREPDVSSSSSSSPLLRDSLLLKISMTIMVMVVLLTCGTLPHNSQTSFVSWVDSYQITYRHSSSSSSSRHISNHYDPHGQPSRRQIVTVNTHRRQPLPHHITKGTIPTMSNNNNNNIHLSRSVLRSRLNDNENDDIGDNDYEDENYDDDDDFDSFSDAELSKLTVSQLKQQLRLRNLSVSGKKHDLVDRLLDYVNNNSSQQSRRDNMDQPTSNNNRKEDIYKGAPSSSRSTTETNLGGSDEDDEVNEIAEQLQREYDQQRRDRREKADKIAEEYGQEFVDVTEYLDEADQGKDIKSSTDNVQGRGGNDGNNDDDDDDEIDNSPLSNPEVWGRDAKIVEDYEGRSLVVDGLSRTVVQFTGSDQTQVQAYVVASRDAMKPFLAGGRNRTAPTKRDPEALLREIQTKREQAAKKPERPGDFDGADEGDEKGLYKDVLHRDYSDWGKYTATGAQLSAQEVQGVLFLTDVFGPFTEATKALAEKIAFECQPIVVMVPDLFRSHPWKEDMTTPGFNKEGQDYEEWRATHPDIRVSVDIRAAAAVLRERYGVSSVIVWGTCFGGGRALEAAAGYLPDNKVLDVDGSLGPPVVDPDVVIAWYPTRYNAKLLFGPDRSSSLMSSREVTERSLAVMGVFAENDQLPGATPSDAEELKGFLENDERIKDCMIKVFPDQDHGFAHNSLGRNQDLSELDRFVDGEFGGAGRVSIDDGDPEVACLLSTAFMETYSRQFLPTAGTPIMLDESVDTWNKNIFMQKPTPRDVRAEQEALLRDMKKPQPEGIDVDPDDADYNEQLLKALQTQYAQDGKLDPEIGDEVRATYEKMLEGDDSFQLF